MLLFTYEKDTFRNGHFPFHFSNRMRKSSPQTTTRGLETILPPTLSYHNSAPGEVDDLPLKDLIEGIESEITFLEGKVPTLDFQFGDEKFTQGEYIRGLRRFVELAKAGLPQADFYIALSRDFDFYEVYGKKTGARCSSPPTTNLSFKDLPKGHQNSRLPSTEHLLNSFTST